MPEPRVTLYLRLAPALAAEIEADRVAFGIPTTTGAAEAILRAGLDARAAARQGFAAIRPGTPPAASAAPVRPASYADTFAAAARVVFGLRGNDFDAEAVAFRLDGAPGVALSDLSEVLRELCQLGLITDLSAATPRGPGRPRKPKYRVAAATKDEAARILAEAARSGAITGRGEVLIGMTHEREAEIADGPQLEPLPEDCPPLDVPQLGPVGRVMAHLLAHSHDAFTAGEVADAVGIGVDEALTILRDMVDDDAVTKTRQTPSRTVYTLVDVR